jgi:hypothetical protein
LTGYSPAEETTVKYSVFMTIRIQPIPDFKEMLKESMEAEAAGGFTDCHVRVPTQQIESPESIFETDHIVEYADAQRIAKAVEETLQTVTNQIARMANRAAT